jgi:hypothetical protein
MREEKQRRMRLGFKIVEMLEMHFQGLKRSNPDDWDTDEAVKAVASVLPQTMADLDAELDEMIPKDGGPIKPSPVKSEFSKLREVLGIDDNNIGIVQTIKAARERIDRSNEVLSSAVKLIQIVDDRFRYEEQDSWILRQTGEWLVSRGYMTEDEEKIKP